MAIEDGWERRRGSFYSQDAGHGSGSYGLRRSLRDVWALLRSHSVMSLVAIEPNMIVSPAR